MVLPSGDPTKCPVIQRLRAAGIHMVVSESIPHSEDRVRWILGNVAAERPEVAVVNLVVPAYHAGRWMRAAGIPTIGIIHSDDPFYRGLQERFLMGRRRDRVTAFVGVSKFITDDLHRLAPRGVTVRAIPYGVEIPAEPVRWDDGPLRIAYAGRLVEPQKRVSVVARAFCRAARDVPDVEAVLYGEGKAQPDVESILVAQSSDGRVRLGGRIEAARIQAVLSACHVIVLLSDYEGLPVALLDAMACGCVPVCRNIRSGIPELIEHERTGLLVEDDEEGFVAAIRRIREDAALWERLSKAARQRVRESYSAASCADGWAALIRELAASARAGPERPLRVPRRIRLAPPHPGFAHEDPRRPTIWRRALGRARRLTLRNFLS